MRKPDKLPLFLAAGQDLAIKFPSDIAVRIIHIRKRHPKHNMIQIEEYRACIRSSFFYPSGKPEDSRSGLAVGLQQIYYGGSLTSWKLSFPVPA
jgi:hypothetical protein